jgi:hypothetical protein
MTRRAAPAETSSNPVKRVSAPLQNGIDQSPSFPAEELLSFGGVFTLQRPNLTEASEMGIRGVLEARELTKPAHWRLKTTFWLDVTLLVSVCALQTVPFTGLVLHEWLGLATVGMVFAHLLLSWSWIASQSRRLFAVSARARINYLFNLSLFAGVTAVIFSGIRISQKAIPAVTGTKAASEMDWHWDSLHIQFSGYVLLLSGFHLAINWEWVLAAGRKIFSRIREGAL